MSIEAMTWALKTPLSGTKKILLIGLANHATAEFDHARPAISTLATYTNIHERNVQKALRELEVEGWIECTGEYAVRGRRDRTVRVYRLCVERGGAGATAGSDGVALASERGGAGVSSGVALAPPEPSKGKPSEEPSKDDERVFAYWRERCDHPRAKLTPERRAKVRARLKDDYSVEDLKQAIDGAAVGAFVNDAGVRFDDLELICRSGTKVELFMGRAKLRPNGNGHGLLKSKTYRGLSFDELTPATQANVRESTAMGLEVWDGGRDAWADRERHEREQFVAAAARRNGRAGAVTSENFADED